MDCTNLTLIRHLKTSYNSRGIFQGSIDASIDSPTEQDLDTIRRNLSVLKKGDFDAVYCSALRRTQETALLYGYENPIIEPLINELNFGHYEGMPKDAFSDHDQTLWLNNPEGLVLGEPLSDFFRRIDLFTNKIKGLRVLIFSHGAVMRYLKSRHECNDTSHMNRLDLTHNSIIELSI